MGKSAMGASRRPPPWVIILSSVYLLFVSPLADATSSLDEAILKAAREGDSTYLQELLAKGANVNARDDYGNTPIIFASEQGHLQSVELLLRAGADVNARTSFNLLSALMLAARHGYLEIVKILHERGGEVEVQNLAGYTPLMEAAEGGHTQIVEALLEMGANVNAKGNLRGRTALMIAVSKGYIDIVKLLLKHNAEVNLHEKAEYKVRGIRNFVGVGRDTMPMLEPAMDEDALARLGRTALMEAALLGHHEILDLLLSAGADVNPRDEIGQTALILAADKDPSMVRELLEKGADVNVQTSISGETPLIAAAYAGRLETVEMLIKAGANVNIRAKNGKSALDVALDKGFAEVVKSLRDAEAAK
jgi:ankyrin repeat protein